jgi:mRNA interferase MazF
MISSQLHQAEPDLDEILKTSDADFSATGLKAASVMRLSRLAVIDAGVVVGSLGTITPQRLASLRQKLARWLIAETV